MTNSLRPWRPHFPQLMLLALQSHTAHLPPSCHTTAYPAPPLSTRNPSVKMEPAWSGLGWLAGQANEGDLMIH